MRATPVQAIPIGSWWRPTPPISARFFHRASIALSFFFVLLIAGCGTPPKSVDKLTLAPASFSDLPGWQDDHVAEAVPALLRSCALLVKRPVDTVISASIPEAGKVGDWLPLCARAQQLAPRDDATARAFFLQNFRPYRAANNAEAKGLFTGYYEIELNGSRTKSARFTVPIYGMPKDLVTADLGEFGIPNKTIIGRVIGGKFHPYPDRAAIEASGLGTNAPVLAWADDAVDVFFLHIQGSGVIKLPGGDSMRVGYTAKNGQPYRAVGRVLVDRGALTQDNVSMQSIRAWLAANPKDAQAVMATNPSYVFFRELSKQGELSKQTDGPVGAQGVTLTGGRSLAVDRRFVPLGIPIWVASQNPDAPNTQTKRLVIAQDTGGAITGPVRGDVFWGTGHDAAERAGLMREFGNYYFLLPRLGDNVAAR
jgi:membrane-bound lytic murein transglycosylase A